MRAVPGDRLVIRGHRVGESHRVASIVDVRGEDGAPPYVVLCDDDPHEHVFYPGSDADIEQVGASGGS